MLSIQALQLCGVILDKQQGGRTDRVAGGLGHVCKGKHSSLLLPRFASSLCGGHSLGSATTCLQRQLSPWHPAWQPESWEDKKNNPSWHETLCEMCLTIKLLMTIVIKNLLFQMHFSVSRPERSCTLKFRMVGCLCD